MYPHRIRLRGPWTLRTAEGVLSSVNVSNRPGIEIEPMPSAIELCRHFSWVQPLQEFERLWLVLERSEVTGGRVNDKAFELSAVATDHQECEITSLVMRSNQLVLDTAATQSRQTFPEVSLEVRCSTFLRQAAWSIDESKNKLEITGLLCGVSDTPLELYARVGEINVLYTVLFANKPCSPFRYESDVPLPAEDETPIQIDLVKGGVIWHRVSGKVGRRGQGD